LEAEARKEATLQNAEAAAQAKVIDSKAEIERNGILPTPKPIGFALRRMRKQIAFA